MKADYFFLSFVILLFVVLCIIASTAKGTELKAEAGAITSITINMEVQPELDYLDLCDMYRELFVDGTYNSIHYIDGYCYGELE